MRFARVRACVSASLSALALTVGLAGCGGDDARADDEHADRGDITVSWSQPPDPLTEQLAVEFRKSHAFEDLAVALNTLYKLPRDLPIVHVACGEANAFYDPQRHTLFMCYEMMETVFEVATQLGTTEDEVGAQFAGTWMFVLFHELGHALIDYYDLPVLAKEEDAADNFSAIMMLESGLTEYLLHAAIFWKATDSGMYDEGKFADEHSLNVQRLYQILCNVYGSDPQRYRYLVENGVLPATRADSCPAEYRQMMSSWSGLLEPWMK